MNSMRHRSMKIENARRHGKSKYCQWKLAKRIIWRYINKKKYWINIITN